MKKFQHDVMNKCISQIENLCWSYFHPSPGVPSFGTQENLCHRWSCSFPKLCVASYKNPVQMTKFHSCQPIPLFLVPAVYRHLSIPHPKFHVPRLLALKLFLGHVPFLYMTEINKIPFALKLFVGLQGQMGFCVI